MDKNTTVEELKQAIAEFRDERDWKQFHTPKDLAITISAEANELLALFRFRESDVLEESDKHEQFERELADVFIAAMALANITGVDISKIIKEKIKEIKAKYPVDKAKGSAKKYTEL